MRSVALGRGVIRLGVGVAVTVAGDEVMVMVVGAVVETGSEEPGAVSKVAAEDVIVGPTTLVEA